MKRIFGHWILDIAKYFVTALFLSSLFADVSSVMPRWLFYLGNSVIILVVILAGVYLIKKADKEDAEKKKKKKSNK